MATHPRDQIQQITLTARCSKPCLVNLHCLTAVHDSAVHANLATIPMKHNSGQSTIGLKKPSKTGHSIVVQRFRRENTNWCLLWGKDPNTTKQPALFAVALVQALSFALLFPPFLLLVCVCVRAWLIYSSTSAPGLVSHPLEQVCICQHRWGINRGLRDALALTCLDHNIS